MTPSELADRLEKLEAVGHMNTMDTTMFLNRNLILKALRFAGHMERLESRCENIRLHKNGGAWYLDADCMDGPNIHSVENNQSIFDAVSEAARKAVEALENGEGK